MSEKLPKFLLLITLFILVTGCREINKTFTNHHGVTATEFRLTVRIPGAGLSFPAVEIWYKGRTPTITAKGGGIFVLSWNHIRIPSGEDYHVGCEFSEDQDDIQIMGGHFNQPHGGVSARQDVYQDRHTKAITHVGLTLYHEDDFQEDVTITSLQWALSKKHYPLGVLDWEDPIMDELSWQDFPDALPYDLAWGEERSYSLPVEDLGTATHVLVRWKATSPHPSIRGQYIEMAPVIQTSTADLLGSNSQQGN